MKMNKEIEIRKAEEKDIEGIVRLIECASAGLEHREWFVPDDEAFVKRHIESDSGSFVLVADCSRADGRGKALAGYLIVRHPGDDDDNLGILISKEKKPLENMMNLIFHMESAAVSADYSGRHIQYCLMAAAEEELKRTVRGPLWLCGTVHPENTKSLHTFLRLGYEIAATMKKYGGLDRHIMCKYCYESKKAADFFQ